MTFAIANDSAIFNLWALHYDYRMFAAIYNVALRLKYARRFGHPRLRSDRSHQSVEIYADRAT